MTAGFALVRACCFAGLMIVFGAQAFALLLGALAPQLRDCDLPARWLMAAAAVALAANVLSLGFVAAQMTALPPAFFDPHIVGRVIADTVFGHAAIVRVVLLAVVLGLVSCKRGRWAVMIAAGVALASFALTSHAAADGAASRFLVRALNDAVHLLAAGFWVGGLGLLIRAAMARRSPAELAAMLRVFSDFATPAVAMLVIAGVVNAVLILGPVPARWDPLYAWLLAFKIALAGGMIVLALVNRFALMPKLARGGARASPALAMTMVVELGLATAVLVIVGFLGLMRPLMG